MKSMLYMSILWKIHYDYKKELQERKRVKICKKQFNNYLNYLESKNIRINNYVSLEDLPN